MVFMKDIMAFNKQQLHLNKKGDDKLLKRLSTKSKIMVAILVLVICIAIVVPICMYAASRNSTNIKYGKDYWLPSYESSAELGIYSSAAISTDANHCAPIGKDMLKRNGSAVDAAIAVLLCMGAVNPQSMGLGGGFLMMVYQKKSGKVHYINAREKAPLKATENMYDGNNQLSQRGGLSIAVPGELVGYEKAHEMFGSLSWKELFEPTIKMCLSGIEVGKHLDKHLKSYANEFEAKDEWHFFINNATGKLHKLGDKIFRPDLAETLRIIANDGSRALYDKNHYLAQQFLEDLKQMGSIITEEDMERYTAETHVEPVKVKLRDNITLYSANAPGSGALLGMMANILDGYNITKDVAKSKKQSVFMLHRMLEAFKFAYARRFELEDNKTTMPDFIANITSKTYADNVRAKIDDSRTYSNLEYYGIDKAFTEDHGTASMALIAPNGDAVVVTSTINLYFGSLTISKSTGIVLNDEMDDFSLPNVTSYFDVPPSPFNRIRPEKRPASSMCPTIAIDANGDVRLALSGNGGTKITTSVFQVCLRNLWLNEDPKTSIDAPRFHHQLIPNYVSHEDKFPKDLVNALQDKGHVFDKQSGMSGIIVALTRDKDGKIYANSDFRKGGDIDGF